MGYVPPEADFFAGTFVQVQSEPSPRFTSHCKVAAPLPKTEPCQRLCRQSCRSDFSICLPRPTSRVNQTSNTSAVAPPKLRRNDR